MYTHFLGKWTVYRVSGRVVTLTALWLIGLLSGIGLAFVYSHSVPALFCGAISDVASPLAMVLIAALPVVVISVALRFSLFPLCCLVMVTEAMCRGFTGIVTSLSVNSAAWVVRPMLLFTGGCVSVCLWWLIIRHCNGRALHFFRDVCLAMLLTAVAAVIDIFCVSPFLRDLSIYF